MRYFEDNTHWKTLETILLSQVGAKFLHMAMVENRAFDCSTFVGYAYKKAGILSEVRFDFYSVEWFRDNPNFLVENIKQHFIHYISHNLQVREISTEEDLFRGDLILMATWKKGIANHAAIYLGNDQIIHCRPQSGVEVRPFQKSWFANRLEKIFRIEVI